MRVAVLTSLFPTPARPFEGVFAQERWSRMLRRGHEVRVIHPLPRAPRGIGPSHWREIASAPADEERAGLRVVRPRYWHLPGRAARNARAFAKSGVSCLLSDEQPDVVVADYAWPAAFAAEDLGRRGLPFVVHGRGSDVLQVAAEPELRGLLVDSLRRAGHWCAVSDDLVRALDELAEKPGHGELTPNGVDTERFTPCDQASARTELGLPAEGPLILVVGHLIERKDPHTALAAFASFARTRPTARLAFVGRGPLGEALAQDVRERGLEGSVQFAGECPPERLARWYAACDALLLTSTREGRPNVVLEALACGRPVLATPAGGSFELLAGLPEGRASSRDPGKLAEELGRLLSVPRSPEALRTLIQPWSWQAGLEALERVLDAARGATAQESVS